MPCPLCHVNTVRLPVARPSALIRVAPVVSIPYARGEVVVRVSGRGPCAHRNPCIGCAQCVSSSLVRGIWSICHRCCLCPVRAVRLPIVHGLACVLCPPSLCCSIIAVRVLVACGSHLPSSSCSRCASRWSAGRLYGRPDLCDLCLQCAPSSLLVRRGSYALLSCRAPWPRCTSHSLLVCIGPHTILRPHYPTCWTALIARACYGSSK